MSASPEPRPVWIFGYGSLVWRPAFPFAQKAPGYVVGWARRFWQGSTDHRGVPGAPGRVVTLVPEAGARCWGMAYLVEPDRAADVLGALDHREKGGYARHRQTVFRPDGTALDEALLYVATPDNPNYLGAAVIEDLVRQVRASHGPSGPNVEYVLELARALRAMGADDPHVFELASLLG